MDRCPICNAELVLTGGADSGYGELKMYWTCAACGSSGTAVLNAQDGNNFHYHEIDERADIEEEVA